MINADEALFSANIAPHLLMIAGGTGLTPMYQIIKSSLKDPKDRTKLCLIYANIEEDDIRELSHLASQPTRLFWVRGVS